MPCTEAWLRFARLEIPPRRAVELLDVFGSPEAVLDASRTDLEQIGGLSPKTIDRILAGAPNDVIARDLAAMSRCGATILTIQDAQYPDILRQIADPPPVLFVRGKLQEQDRLAVAVVGSRNPTSYGLMVAEKMGRGLAECGFTVVSGLARGIDAAAHKGAISTGRTVAVLGCGVDVAYPAENRRLLESIAEKGAVISEAPMRVAPDAWRFPARNRIISGLSLGVVLCQARLGSGALITADFALEQGRDVFAVPGDVLDGRSRGCHMLIKQGAALVESHEDVLVALGVPVGELKPKQSSPPMQLSLDESRLLNLLALQQRHVDDLVAETEMSAAQVNALLLVMELRGLVKRLPGGTFIRVAY